MDGNSDGAVEATVMLGSWATGQEITFESAPPENKYRHEFLSLLERKLKD